MIQLGPLLVTAGKYISASRVRSYSYTYNPCSCQILVSHNIATQETTQLNLPDRNTVMT